VLTYSESSLTRASTWYVLESCSCCLLSPGVFSDKQDFYLDEPSNPRDYELVEVESDETPFDDEDLPYVEDVIVNEGSPSGPLEGGEWVVDVLDNDQPLPSGRFGWEPEEKVEKEEPDWDGDNVPDAVGEERLNRFDYGDERSPTGGLPGGQEVFAAA